MCCLSPASSRGGPGVGRVYWQLLCGCRPQEVSAAPFHAVSDVPGPICLQQRDEATAWQAGEGEKAGESRGSVGKRPCAAAPCPAIAKASSPGRGALVAEGMTSVRRWLRLCPRLSPSLSLSCPRGMRIVKRQKPARGHTGAEECLLPIAALPPSASAFSLVSPNGFHAGDAGVECDAGRALGLSLLPPESHRQPAGPHPPAHTLSAAPRASLAGGAAAPLWSAPCSDATRSQNKPSRSEKWPGGSESRRLACPQLRRAVKHLEGIQLQPIT